MKFITTRKYIIRKFAEEIAGLQRRADIYFYKQHNQEHSSWLLDQCLKLTDFAWKLGILDQVIKEAYKIYDFRNSGRDGYALKDGRIVPAKEPPKEAD